MNNSVFSLASILGSTVSFALILYALRFMRKIGGFSFLQLATMSVLAGNGLGLAFVDKVDLELLGAMPDEVAVFRGSIALLVFAVVSFVSQKLVGLRPIPQPPIAALPMSRKKSFPPRPAGALLLSLGVALMVFISYYFLILNRAYEHIGTAFLRETGEAHYVVREAFSLAFTGTGRGGYMASVAIFLVGPVLLPSLFLCWINSKSYLALTGVVIAWICQISMSLSMGQRAPVLYSFLLPLLALAATRLTFRPSGRALKKYGAQLALFLGFSVLGFAGFIYSLTDDITIVEGVGRFLSRIFLVPIVSAGYIYQLFPESVPYRGLLRSFNMENVGGMSSDFNFGDVAEAMTNYRFDANSSLLSVAYSGYEYVGVAVVSFAFCIGCCFVDRLLSRLPVHARNLAFVSSLYSLVAAVNVSLWTAIFCYGLGVCAVGSVVLYRMCYGFPPAAVQAPHRPRAMAFSHE